MELKECWNQIKSWIVLITFLILIISRGIGSEKKKQIHTSSLYKRYWIYLCLPLILWKTVLLFLSGIFQRSKDNNANKIVWHWIEGNITKIIGLFLAFTLEYNSAGHWIQCQNDCYTWSSSGLVVGFLKDHSNKLKVGETSQLLFLAFSSGVTT